MVSTLVNCITKHWNLLNNQLVTAPTEADETNLAYLAKTPLS
jgi:hypothetical protein